MSARHDAVLQIVWAMTESPAPPTVGMRAEKVFDRLIDSGLMLLAADHEAEVERLREEASLLRFAIRRFSNWMDLDPSWEPTFEEALANNFGEPDEMAKAIRLAWGSGPGGEPT